MVMKGHRSTASVVGYFRHDGTAARAAHLLDQYRQGALDKAGNWQLFESLVTGNIQNDGQDGHLYVRYNPQIVKTLQAPEDTAAAE